MGHNLHKFLDRWCNGNNVEVSTWADLNGDGKADFICDTTVGDHFARF